MAIAHTTKVAPAREEIAVRQITVADLRIALIQGWEDFMSKRGDLVFLGLIYPIVVLLAALYALQTSIVALFFPLFSGAILLGPAAASGFYELARRREQGLDSRWRHYFDVFRNPSLPSLAALTTITAMLFILWIGTASMIYSATLAAHDPQSVNAFIIDLFTTPEGWTMIILGNLVGLVFAAITLAISVVSFPMLVDGRVGWETAIRTSLRVTRENPVTISIWGLVVVALLLLGCVTAFVGLAVILPLLGYATWHLYTRAVVR